MVSHKLFAAVTALSLITLPAMAQTGAGNETNGHHYSGGPKTVVPHHMGKKDTTVDASTKSKSGGHHYNGGPGTTVPHQMGDKQ
jgi:hypothetical protein